MGMFDKLTQRTQASPEYQNAWSGFNPSNMQSGLSQGMLDYLNTHTDDQNNATSKSADGRYTLTRNNDANLNAMGYTIQDNNGGAYWDYGTDGKYQKFRTKSMDNNMGVFLPLLAAAGGIGMMGFSGGAGAGASGAGAAGGYGGSIGSTFTPGMWGGAAVPQGAGFGLGGGGLSSGFGAGAMGGAAGAGGVGYGLGTTLGEGALTGAGGSFTPGMWSGEVPAGSGFNMAPSQLPPAEFTPGSTPFNYGTGGAASPGGLNSILDKLTSNPLSTANTANNLVNKNKNRTVADVVNLAGGAYGAQAQGDAADKMMAWMKAQQDKIDNLYNPGTAEYDALWNEMSRKDAASGRNSQYGVRSTDLAGKVAGIKSDANVRLTGALSGPYARALQQDAAKYSGVTAPLGSLFENSELSDLSSIFSSLGISGEDISSFLNSFGAG